MKKIKCTFGIFVLAVALEMVGGFRCEAATKSYKQVYYEIVKENSGISSDYTYTLFYLNNDNIPELLVDKAPYSMDIYTYKKGKAIKIGKLENGRGYGGTYYYPKKGLVISKYHDYWNVDGPTISHCYKLKNEKLTLYKEYKNRSLGKKWKELEGKYNAEKICNSKLNDFSSVKVYEYPISQIYYIEKKGSKLSIKEDDAGVGELCLDKRSMYTDLDRKPVYKEPGTWTLAKACKFSVVTKLGKTAEVCDKNYKIVKWKTIKKKCDYDRKTYEKVLDRLGVGYSYGGTLLVYVKNGKVIRVSYQPAGEKLKDGVYSVEDGYFSGDIVNNEYIVTSPLYSWDSKRGKLIHKKGVTRILTISKSCKFGWRDGGRFHSCSKEKFIRDYLSDEKLPVEFHLKDGKIVKMYQTN